MNVDSYHNPDVIDRLYEAQTTSRLRFKCDKCGHIVKGFLPGFPVWWLPVSYSVLGYATHDRCGGKFHETWPAVKLSGSSYIAGIA